MAYGYATGNYNPQVQSAGNKAAATSKPSGTTVGMPGQETNGQQQMFSSPAGSAVTPTGQINQQPMAAPPMAAGGMGAAPLQQPNSTFYNWTGSPMMSQMQGAIMGALGQDLWSPERIAQMKGAQQDATGLMTQQLQQQVDQNAAGRGTLGSGQHAATSRRLQQGMAGDLMGRYRDIDLQTTEANRNAMLQMLGMGMDFTQMDEGLSQAAVGTALANRDMDIRRLLGLEGISAQREGNRMNMAGNLIGSLLGYQSGLDRLGFDYTALDASQQNALLNRLLGGMF